MLKAFLKSSDNIFVLAPKVTTLGKDGCDIIIQTPGVDQQHAVIEYNEQEDCYILQDLNTAQGTYVNDCRVQNATVRLAPKDIIRLGYNGAPFELNVENPPPERSHTSLSLSQQIAYPPVQQRPAWTQPLTLLTDNMTLTQQSQQEQSYAAQQMGMQTLPYLATGTTTITIPSQMWTPSHQMAGGNMPRPPLRNRPLSAGSTSSRRVGTATFDQIRRNQGMGVSPVMSPAGSQRSVAMSGGWVNGVDRRPSTTTQMPVNVDISKIQEKEQKIMQLSDEVNRLRSIEMESLRKDQILQQLQQQLNESQQRFMTQGPLIMGTDIDTTQRVVQLENELTMKKQEIAMLREQLSSVHSDSPSSPKGVMTDELSQKIKELNNVKNEMERVKKDKSITSGLVTQMQRDMSSKDSTISKLTREIETLKKELREKDSRITTMSAKVTKLSEPTVKNTDERDAREKELISLRQKFKSTENKIQEQHDLINKLKEELENTKLSLIEEKQIQKKQQIDADQISAELKDMQRAERLVRVDLEQATKRIERFRSRVVQVTFSTPGVRAPEAEISDDELIESLKKIIDERTTFYQKVKEIEKEIKAKENASNTFNKTVSELRNHIQSIVAHLNSNGFLVSSLGQEIELLQSVCTDESLVWVRDLLVELLKSAMAWEQKIESSLEKCGVNIKLSNDDPGKHIAMLFAKWESSIGEKDRLSEKIVQMEKEYKSELQLTIDTQKKDAENRVADAIEKTKQEAEEKLNRSLEEIRAVEMDKRENVVKSERRRVEELEESMAQLRQNYIDLQNSSKSQVDETSELVKQIEEYANSEKTLAEEIEKLQSEKSSLEVKVTQMSVEYDKKHDDELNSYREQNKQHSVTICAMEERLVKLNKKCKEFQEENTEHKKVAHELRAELSSLKNKPPPKPVIPPKPKVIIQKPSEDFVAMENVIVVLRKENIEIKSKVQDQEDVILGLRRDLAGAHARLSDITGELSETQKQENEKSRELVLQRERELTDVRQQLAKLSKIIDKQKEELKSLQVELSKEKSITLKYKSNVEEYQSKLEGLEGDLLNEREEQKRQLTLLDQEGRITSEMTALGAQCRGERHEQVITRQKEALAELRGRIKTLEVSKPPLPTQDQALQQVIMLKKELAEMRANQALSEDKIALGSLDREVTRARGLLANVNPEADMERSAHRETLDALESSENSYLILLRAMGSCLELETVEGLRQIGHLPKDERERLLSERENSCQLLANRIKVLKERIARKDELLQGYERDLVKMRQSQELADRKAHQVETLSNDVKTRAEETQYLRESLNRTRDRLDQEKRLNTAIKQRKTFHLENESSHLHSTSSRHTCYKDDAMGKNKNKRVQKEVTKRKNYEIKTLKSELSDKERALYDTEYRLATLENSMGIPRASDAIES